MRSANPRPTIFAVPPAPQPRAFFLPFFLPPFLILFLRLIYPYSRLEIHHFVPLPRTRRMFEYSALCSTKRRRQSYIPPL
jgi:hypothetical protein